MPRLLNQPTTNRVLLFCESTGLKPEHFLSKITNEWLDSKGDYVARKLQTVRRKIEQEESAKLTRNKATRTKKVTSQLPNTRSTNVSPIANHPRYRNARTITSTAEPIAMRL